MKTFYCLTLALALTAGAASAQSTATVTQTGDYSTATVEQSGAAHTATITTNSGADAAGDGNTAAVTQTSAGAGDVATIVQGNAAAGRTVQDASATILQEGNDGSVGANTALIRQNVDQSGVNVTSSIEQNGSGNTAETWFSSNQRFGDRTEIDQDGYSNRAYQSKDDEREGSLVIEQDNQSYGAQAAGNQAEQYTRKDQARDLYIRQVGDGNYALQDVFKGSYVTTTQYGEGNDAYIVTPGGSNNDLTIIQGDEAGAEMSYDNYARIDAEGGANTARIAQYGAGLNTADVDMSGGALLDVLQRGQGNVLLGLDGTSAAQVLGGSQLTVDQIGDLNAAYVSQSAGAVGVISQTGSNNVATINQ